MRASGSTIIGTFFIACFLGVVVTVTVLINNFETRKKENRPEPKTLTVGKIYCIGNFEFVATGGRFWSRFHEDWEHELITSVGEDEYFQEAIIKECST